MRRTVPVLPLVLGSVVVFFVGHALARALARLPELYLFPLTEDGYYSLTVARHLAQGHGPTVDGRTLTNGFQPLWVLLVTPVFAAAGGDVPLAIRGVLVAHWTIYAATLGLVAAIAARVAPHLRVPASAAALTAALLYSTNVTIYELHFNGLETGLVLLLHALLAVMLLRLDWNSTRQVAALGVLTGTLMLARIDAVFVAAGVIVCPWLQGVPLRRTIATVSAVWGIALLMVAPWLLFNVLQFGSLMPSSGLAQQDWGWRPGRIAVALAYVAGHLVPLSTAFCYPSRHETAAGLILLVAGGFVATRVALGTLRIGAPFRIGAIGAPSSVAVLFVVEAAALAVWYGASSFAWWMFQRYTAPVLVCAVPAMAVAWLRVTRSHPAALVFLASGCVGFAALGLWGARTAELRERSHFEQVRIAETVAPPGEWVGALQSGTLGFFRANVLNLDGKVNREALRAAAGLDEYARRSGVTWLVDWPALLQDRVFRNQPPRGWRLQRVVQVPGCASCRFAVYRLMPYP